MHEGPGGTGDVLQPLHLLAATMGSAPQEAPPSIQTLLLFLLHFSPHCPLSPHGGHAHSSPRTWTRLWSPGRSRAWGLLVQGLHTDPSLKPV